MRRRNMPEKYKLKDHDFAKVMKGNPKTRNVRKKLRRAAKRHDRLYFKKSEDHEE